MSNGYVTRYASAEVALEGRGKVAGALCRRRLDDVWTTFGRVKTSRTSVARRHHSANSEREKAECNALLTRRVTDAVTVPRPDPTRPDPNTVLAVVFPPSDSNRIRSNGDLRARFIGFGVGR